VTRDFDLLLMRRNPLVMGLATIPFLLCPLALVLGVLVNPGFFALLFHGALFGTIALYTAWTLNPWPRAVDAKIRVERDAVWIGERRIPRDELVGGYLVPISGERITVRLQRKGIQPDIELITATEEEGTVLLRALGFAAEQSVVAFRAMSMVHAHMWKMIFGVFAVLAATFALQRVFGSGGAGLAPILFLLFAGVSLLPTRVEVGADGVLIRWFGRERFVRHDAIELAWIGERGWGRSRRKSVLLKLVSGEELEIPVSSITWDRGRAEALVARIHAAMEARRAGSEVAPEALLRRGDTGHVDWVRTLRAGRALATHRRAAPLGDQLWRIVEDPAGEPLTRAAAAVALGPELAPDERARLQHVAGATAAPRLRIALDAVADGEDEEAVGEALEALEKESLRAG